MRTWIWIALSALLPLVSQGQFLWTEHTVNGDYIGAASVYATDVDGDGDTDLLGAASYLDDITWWENIGGNGQFWAEHTVSSDFDGANCVYAEDVDGDGDIDILGAAWTADDITWWENVNGGGLCWIEHTVDGDFDSAEYVYAEDVDSDGDIDVLGAADGANEIAWWENINGGGQCWAKHSVDNEYDYAQGVFASDVDGDGDIDVLGAAADVNEIAWWENVNGSGLDWVKHTVDNDFDCAESVYATDMDNDGDIDVLGAAFYDDEIAMWENVDGDGLNWFKHSVDLDSDGARDVYAADVDSDGDIDVLSAAWHDNSILLWEQKESYLTVELEPFCASIVIPPAGGYIQVEVRIINTSDEFEWFSAWAEVQLPNGEMLSPLQLNYVGMIPYGSLVTVLIQGVPGFAPPGEYLYTVRVGTFPNQTFHHDSFSFTKNSCSPERNEFVNDWTVTDWDHDTSSDDAYPILPSEFSVGSADANNAAASSGVSIFVP